MRTFARIAVPALLVLASCHGSASPVPENRLHEPSTRSAAGRTTRTHDPSLRGGSHPVQPPAASPIPRGTEAAPKSRTQLYLDGILASVIDPHSAASKQAAKSRAQPYLDGMAALERYRSSTEVENDDSRTVQAKIAELEEDAGLVPSGGSLQQFAHEARQRHTDLAFAFAEEALRKRALDAADRTYRRLVEFYVGNVYSGIRERARIGIDDVRSLRPVAAPTK